MMLVTLAPSGKLMIVVPVRAVLAVELRVPLVPVPVLVTVPALLIAAVENVMLPVVCCC